MSDVSGRLGAIVENPPRRTRTLRVEVRVGDYTFDSSRFVMQGFGGGGRPVGRNGHRAARRRLRRDAPRNLADDRCGVQARHHDVRAQEGGVSEPHGERSDSGFFRGAAGRNDHSGGPAAAGRTEGGDRADLLARVQQASAVFAAHPDVDLSEVAITQVHGTRYYLNSEGFKTVAPIQITSLTMYGEAQAGDGMPVRRDVQRRGPHAGRSSIRGRTRRAGEADRRRCRRRARRADRRGIRRARC